MKSRQDFSTEKEWLEYLRVQFAAMAMQGLISKYSLTKPEDQDIVSQMSIQLSDSLIAELNKPKP